MIDWHTHILHKIDDGSKDLEESISLLKSLSEQKAEIVVASPHFYANDESVNNFLERRNRSFEELREKLPDNAPKIKLGAEVRYYSGISRMDNLDKLCIEGSNLLLLEMSFSKWTEYTIKELVELSVSGNFRLVLAHIERYLKLQSESVWNRLYENGILMQVNASFFNDFFTRNKALGLLKKGKIHLIGSDCHNMINRPPQIGKAYDIIERKLGSNFLNAFNKYGKNVLE